MSSKPSDYFLSSRPDKTLQWLEESRDSWKEKTKATKDDLKKQKLAVKRARDGRDLLHEELSKEKTAHYRAKEALSQKDVEISELKTQLAKVTQQVEDLKKKRLLR
jgi:septal ring factor EnvC (AmiA/AmiB activator)